MSYLKGLTLIILTWIIDPTIGIVAEALSSTGIDYYLNIFRASLSTLTTILIFLVALIKYLRERKKK